MPKKSKLLDEVRHTLRRQRKNYRTEPSYIDWIYRFIVYHKKRHPAELSEEDVGRFLSFLAEERHVSASTQNQALQAILFLYKQVLRRPMAEVATSA